MKSLEVASRKLFFKDVQPQTSPPRATVLFVHGAGGSHLSWQYQLEQLSDRFRIIAVDLPGHGLSERDETATIRGYSNYVLALMEDLTLENVVLGGHSMGGAIALDIALNHPAKVGGLLLVGTGARLRVLPAIFSTIRDDFDVAIEGMGNFFFGSKTSEDIIAGQKELLAKNAPEVLIQDFSACDSFDIIEDISNISLPTLIVCGTEDRLTPPKYSEFLHDKIEGSDIVFFDGCGHMPMLEQGAGFNDAIASFLDRLPKQ